MIRRRNTSLLGSPRSLGQPRRPQPAKRTIGWWLMISGVVALAVVLLWPVLSMLFAGFVIGYILDPLVDRIEARGVSRTTSVVAVFAGIFFAVLAFIGVVVPSVAANAAELSSNVGEYTARLKALVDPAAVWFESTFGVAVPLSLEAISAEAPRVLESLSPDARESLQAVVTQALSGSVGFFLQLLNLALLPIFAFYIVRDWDHSVAWFQDKIPVRLRPTLFPLLSEVDERLSAFLRGQLTVCCVLAVLYSVGLWGIARIDLAVVVGVTSGLLFIVPYLGTAFGVIAGTLLALLKYGVDVHVLYVWGVFGVAQLVEGWFLTPVVVGDKVGLHPLIVMVALLAGANLLGIWGMLFAIPVAATLSVLLTAWLTHYRKSSFYLG